MKITLVLLLALVCMLSFSVSSFAADPPDGFVGIKWGASQADVAQLAKVRGYRDRANFNLTGVDIVPYDSPEAPAYQGEFLNYPCFYQFHFMNNNFYLGIAQMYSTWDHSKYFFADIKKQLTEKYGPPTTFRDSASSWKITGNDGKEIVIGVLVQPLPKGMQWEGRIVVSYENLSLKKILRNQSL